MSPMHGRELKKKLLISTDFYAPHWTGIAKSVRNLVQELSSSFDITVITMRYRTELAKKESSDGAQIFRESILFPFSRGCFSLSIWYRFLRELPKAELVLLNSPSINILPLALFAKLFCKRLVIFHQADIILPAGFINRVIELNFRIHTKIAFALANAVSCYSKDYAEHSVVLQKFLSKFTPFRMPVSSSTPQSTPRVEVLSKLSQEKSPLFGFAGRFVHEKGFDVLLKAIPLIQKELPNSRFVFAGEINIPYENFYQESQKDIGNLKESLTLLGLLNDQELAFFYASIDVFLMPSRSDCFGLVQAEAALMGTPVVASDIPGCRDLVRQTQCGVLFESENPQSLAEQALRTYYFREEYIAKIDNVRSYLSSEERQSSLSTLFGPHKFS